MRPDGKRILAMLTTLTPEQRRKYYTICGKAEIRLRDEGIPWTLQHCELICASLKDDRPVTLAMLKKLPPTQGSSSAAQLPDLFGGAESGS